MILKIERLFALEQEEKQKKLIEKLFILQYETNYIVFHTYECLIIDVHRLQLSTVKCPLLYTQFYSEQIKVDNSLWNII